MNYDFISTSMAMDKQFKKETDLIKKRLGDELKNVNKGDILEVEISNGEFASYLVIKKFWSAKISQCIGNELTFDVSLV